MLNERNIVTHGGARFQTNHVLRMLRHRGYTGYMIAKENTSGFIPELQIVEESIYEDAMAIVEQRKKKMSSAAASRKVHTIRRFWREIYTAHIAVHGCPASGTKTGTGWRMER